MLGAARPGEVVIHNHPSGVLVPSEADLQVAGALGSMGVGFLIVDNPVERVYVVVEPHRPRPRAAIADGPLGRDLGPQGSLAGALTGYEYRESQVEMAGRVAEGFDADGVAVIEAGTGTGKSFAYLFPAVRFAKANEEKVVVSTNTINLQTQLLEKDIPGVARALGEEVRATLVKGRTNYICLRKLGEARAQPGLLDEDGPRAQLDEIARYAANSEVGDKQGLGFVPDPAVWEQVQSESDTTLRVRCPHYNECFFYNSRRRAATADVVVSNHHLLMADVALRREVGFGVSALLPPYRRLIIDEAHHLEDAATAHMSEQTTRLGLARSVGKLLPVRKSEKGRLPRLIERLLDRSSRVGVDATGQAAQALAERAQPALRKLQGEIDHAFLAMEEGFEEHLGAPLANNRDARLRLTRKVEGSRFYQECLVPQVRRLADALAVGAEAVLEALRPLERMPEEELQAIAGPMLEVRASARRIEDRGASLRYLLSDDEDTCRWIEMRRGRRGLVLKLCHAPIEVGPALRESLFDRVSTAVLTSATLRTGPDFGYLLGRLGLADGVDGRLTTAALASPFDYARQAFVGVPTDLPRPSDRAFADELGEAVGRALEVSHGRAFVLFTSYRLLDRVHARLAPRLRAFGFEPLRQGTLDRHRLLERFKAEAGSVLFATSSFWEGVDVPGDALQLVVLTKLPFSVPDEPILEARTERIAARGGDPFLEYSVPQAVLRFRQGFGRLIRTRRDRGAVLVMDRRVVFSNYGSAFLEGLPVAAVHSQPLAQVLQGMEDFLRPGASRAEPVPDPAEVEAARDERG